MVVALEAGRSRNVISAGHLFRHQGAPVAIAYLQVSLATYGLIVGR